MIKWIGIFSLLLFTSTSFCSVHYVRPRKTGSSTVAFLLRKHFPKRHQYLEPEPRIFLPESKDLAEAEAQLSMMRDVRPKDLVLGHFPMWFFEEKVKHNSDCFWFITLRDPIERVISQYRYQKKNGFDLNSPCDIQPNHMCRILASDPDLSGEALLENAIKNLHKMDVVIFLEDFEYGIRSLFEVLQLPQPSEIPIKNTTAKTPVDPSLLDQLRDLHSLDILLYEYASTHFGR